MQIIELTKKDLNNGVFEAVYSHFIQTFPSDERRDRKDTTFKNNDIDGERTVRGLETIITTPQTGNSTAHFLAAFEDGYQSNPSDAFRGATLVHSFHDSKLVFGEYVFVAETLRGKGYGSILIREALKRVAVPDNSIGLFAEVEREVDFKDPLRLEQVEARLRGYEKMGLVPLIVDYVQPNYTQEKGTVPLHPMLWNFHEPGKGIDARTFLTFMKQFYKDIYGFEHDDHWHVKHMEYSLKGREVIPVRDPVYTKELGTFAQFMNPK